MWIAPNSTIHLLSGINWTPAYTDAVYFINKTVQLNYMKHKIFRSFDKQSYQRHSKNVLRILATADSLYECNYLMFQNEKRGGQNGDKWFYAFILDIEYVNENTTDVYYEIDVIQTWFWDLKLGMCFVEREIPRYDTLYGNLVPENFETGEYIINTNVPTYLGAPCYIAVCATDIYGNAATTELNEWTIPLKYYAFVAKDNEDPEGLFWNISKLVKAYYNEGNSPENIIAIQGVPAMLLSSDGSTTPNKNYSIPEGEDPFRPQTLINSIQLPNTYLETEWSFDTHLALNGYIPKNNKLHTYPYSFIQVSNNNGQISNYRWENFGVDLYNEPTVTFKIIGTYYGLPTMLLIPENYNGAYLNFDESISLANFPSIPWVTDTYKAYLAQNKASIMTSILCDTVSATAGLASGINMAVLGQAINNNAPNSQWLTQLSSEGQRNRGIISSGSSIANGATDILSTLAKISDVKQKPDTVHGLTQCDMLLTMTNKQHFEVYTKSVKAEMAKIIDDYFSAYGYAQHKFKKPEIITRTYWGYTKTKGCELIGSCPEGIKAQIASIFDSGIRFWNSNEIIGDYSLDNSRPRAESEGN